MLIAAAITMSFTPPTTTTTTPVYHYCFNPITMKWILVAGTTLLPGAK